MRGKDWELIAVSCLICTILAFEGVSTEPRRRNRKLEEDVVDASQDQASERAGKFLSMFQMVKFTNDDCSANGGSMTGTCYTESECSSKGGKNGGSCAQGFGVCCFFQLSCGGESSENNTYFSSTNNDPDLCTVTVCRANDDICQLRLDFQTFNIASPFVGTASEGTSKAGVPVIGGGVNYASTGQCRDDFFSVTSAGNPTPPIICGNNNNQHMYVPVSESGCHTLTFSKRAGAPLGIREWTIQVLQYSCEYPNLAPEGCTKYFFGSTTGSFQSYNFDGSVHLADQREKICIRQELNMVTICYWADPKEDFAVSDNVAGVVGEQSKCCGYTENGAGDTGFDCVIIPGALKKTALAKLNYNEFCGANEGLITDAGSPGLGTVCSQRIPFQVTFLSDSTELAGEGNEIDPASTQPDNKGFRLQYEMKS